jgi:phosphatidylglycerol:prolipoprotein diacylglycerol transferase
MLPKVCQIGPFTIFSYGLMLAIAFITAAFLIRLQAKRQGDNPQLAFNFTYLVFLWGIIGARLFYVLENNSYYRKDPLEIFMLQHGGMSYFGGFFVALAAGFVYLKKKRFPFLRMLDLVAPFLALAQSIGRLGCFLNGCCFGRQSSWGIYFPAHQKTLVPLQLYASLVLVLLFMVLRLMQDRPHKQGRIFLAYVLLYSLKRFFVEFWRADNLRLLFGLTLFQLISLGLFFGGLATMARFKCRNTS